MRPVRSWCVATLILVAGIAGCASSSVPPAASPASTVNRDYPGSSAAPATPVPARSSLYEGIPAACSTVSAATLRSIAPGAGAGTETDASGDGVTERTCGWGPASGSGWTRTLTVFTEIEPGAEARLNASGEYQNEASTDSSPQAVSGLGDKAALSVEQLKNTSFGTLHVLSQNVVITIQYGGRDAGTNMTASELRNGTVATAHAVLAALGGPPGHHGRVPSGGGTP
jgi:hypothetical protein